MKKTLSRTLVLVLFFSYLTGFFLSGSCQSFVEQTIYVGGSGPGNYTVIQDALNDVSVGGTVYVYPGTYHEHLVFTHPVHLIGEDKTRTILDGDFKDYVVIMGAGNSTLSGFTITHSGIVFPLAGIYLTSDENIITGNILIDNFYGLHIHGADHNTISGNEITQNHRCGMYFSLSSNNKILANSVSHQPVNGFGLFEYSNNNTFYDNVVSQNNFSGLTLRDSFYNYVLENHFLDNRLGVFVSAADCHTTFNGNAFSGNTADFSEEQNWIALIGSGFCALLLLVFYLLRNVLL